MTRPFRLEEDERRYFALRSEFFIRLVQGGVPAQTVHDIMRNFGKLEDFMFFEGVRQGMVAALLSRTQDMHHETEPLAVHRDLYGAAATPLMRIEKGALERAMTESDGDHGSPHALHPWLATDPMRFGPLTITEALEQYGPDLVVKPAPRSAPREETRETSAGYRPRSMAEASDRDVEPYDPAERRFDGADPLDPMAILDALANGEDPEKMLGAIDGYEPKELEDPIEIKPDEEPVNKPALLDRIRDILLRLDAPPQTWQDMILMLMREVRVDAGHLDDLMSTPMGMTVVSQAKLFHLHPGAMPEVKAVPAPPR